MKLLIIKISAIGDVIHTLPAVLYLKNTIPQAEIGWIVQEKTASILEHQPFIKYLYVLPNNFLQPKNWNQTICSLKQLKTTKWDAIIDFQGLLKTSILLFPLQGKKFGFSKNHTREKISSFFTHYHTIPHYTNIIQKNLALASTVIKTLAPHITICPTINELKKSFHLSIPHNKKKIVNDWIIRKKINPSIKKIITIAPNTTWPSKHWPLSHWKTLINYFTFFTKKTVQLTLLGKDFGYHAAQLALHCKNLSTQIHCIPQWDLLTTAYFLTKTDLLIAPDTGILHLADFLGIQTIGIFGPTLASKHGPFLHKKNIDATLQIECPHCYKKTHLHQNCMAKLTPAKLFKTILCILNT